MFARAVGKSFVRGARNFSGHSKEEGIAEIKKWSKISYGMIALTCVSAAYNIATHDHQHSETGLSYQNLRNKPYPWKDCPDCSLLQNECWAACRGEHVSSH